jgi:hypothetical protein
VKSSPILQPLNIKKIFNIFSQRISRPGRTVRKVYRKLLSHLKKSEPFPGSEAYWEKRYSNGGDSGAGSFGFFAKFKADIINEFVAANKIQTVIEFGCGDGNQLRLAQYPKYLGFDVSKAAVMKCRESFKTDEKKAFHKLSEYNGEKAELTLSLDVVYHLVEDRVFEYHLKTLFDASEEFVIIYSSNTDDNRGKSEHVRHRKFTTWVQENLPDWKLIKHLPNPYPYHGDHLKGSLADFYIYQKI